MARFLLALLAATVVAVQAGGQLAQAALAPAEVFWRAVLPHSPLPDAILQLVQPAAGLSYTSFLSKGRVKPPFDYQEYIRSSSDDESSERTAGERELEYDDYKGADKRRDATFNPFNYMYKAPSKTRPSPFDYMYKGPSKSQAGERLGAPAGNPFGYHYKAPSSSHAGSGASTARVGKAETTTVFFHEEAVRVGKRLPFYFPLTTPAALGFLPRQVADSVPFTTAALPGVLATFGIASDSATVASMEATLRACESPTIAGESKFCATSLEALVERAMGVLGTRDIRPVTSTLPRAGAPLQWYTVRVVRPVEGGPVFVACHDEAYPYTVYRCHTTGPSRAYMVEMEGARGGNAVTIAAVCHTDTSLWNPEHVSFKLLGTKPGGTPVCHLMPYGHIIWAKNVKRSTA
ncbi:protein RAFTIN 1B isoform X1 [Aegilops tauschii subsp. strangulata]|uniref:protein RAFTIN 1B isoform X1 n=1 Tax=Aegilops tauschii subsp. strangulata TaxID=200361 RepID=UPI001ABC0E29|nr:protein RAFTIN 1B isoform X1 [Aegilops tauschii subsp. strangulata]